MSKLIIMLKEFRDKYPLLYSKLGPNYKEEIRYFTEDELDEWEKSLSYITEITEIEHQSNIEKEDAKIESDEWVIKNLSNIVEIDSSIINVFIPQCINSEVHKKTTTMQEIFNTENLVFNEELENLVDELKDKRKDITKIMDEIDGEIDCYGYKGIYEFKQGIYNDYISVLNKFKKDVVYTIESTSYEIPCVFDSENKFAIGECREFEIRDILDSSIEKVQCMNWESIEIIDEVIDEIVKYKSISIKELINQRKRHGRRNDLGFTSREQKKQNTIEAIQSLKRKGFRQIEVSSKLDISRTIVSRYWNFVNSNGKWENVGNIKNNKI